MKKLKYIYAAASVMTILAATGCSSNDGENLSNNLGGAMDGGYYSDYGSTYDAGSDTLNPYGYGTMYNDGVSNYGYGTMYGNSNIYEGGLRGSNIKGSTMERTNTTGSNMTGNDMSGYGMTGVYDNTGNYADGSWLKMPYDSTDTAGALTMTGR